MMLGSSVGIAWPSAAAPGGAEVDGFLLPMAFDAGSVNAAKGTFAISNAAADYAGGGWAGNVMCCEHRRLHLLLLSTMRRAATQTAG